MIISTGRAFAASLVALITLVAAPFSGGWASAAPARSTLGGSASAHGWGTPVLIKKSDLPTAISCPSATDCMVVTRLGNYSRYDGSRWTPATTPWQSADQLDSVSCTSTTFCVITSYGTTYVSNGSAWKAEGKAQGPQTFVSCTSTTFCLGIDGGSGADRYNGTRWTRTAFRGTFWSTGMSCVSAMFCMGVGTNWRDRFLTKVYRGGHWLAAKSHGAWDGASVGCARGRFCVVGNIDGTVVAYDKGRWGKPVRIARRNTKIDGVSCTSSTFCMAVNAAGRYSIFNGHTWSAGAYVHHNHREMTAVDCVKADLCFATDAAGTVTEYK